MSRTDISPCQLTFQVKIQFALIYIATYQLAIYLSCYVISKINFSPLSSFRQLTCPVSILTLPNQHHVSLVSVSNLVKLATCVFLSSIVPNICLINNFNHLLLVQCNIMAKSVTCSPKIVIFHASAKFVLFIIMISLKWLSKLPLFYVSQISLKQVLHIIWFIHLLSLLKSIKIGTILWREAVSWSASLTFWCSEQTCSLWPISTCFSCALANLSRPAFNSPHPSRKPVLGPYTTTYPVTWSLWRTQKKKRKIMYQ